ncbi:hypothetical protein [Phytopseudomonas seleniipraecipitans]|uniref:Uncharacterized protein n=1 Tax=Phytopseudomonas seleniipraecipitans TaxID=640205 RepID=A0A1G7JE33_9GAMM|nr:hypothetical protein [Pseudomonas seleniipraecipitans]SDF23181.1 hypothetical protein SAMN05216381_1088 [Pseudomonas seleniipraecipitans]
MILLITSLSLGVLRGALNFGGNAVIKLARVGDPNQQLSMDINVELVDHMVRLRIAAGETTGEIKLAPGQVGYLKAAVTFIEDVANGRIETASQAEPAASSGTIQLTTCDERTLRTVCRTGGHTALSSGTVVTVHASENQSLRTGIAVHGARTHLVSGSAQDVYLSLAEHIQQLIAA